MKLVTMTYQVEGRVARITLNRPKRGNGITMDMPRELEYCVEQADIDQNVHVIALSGNGSGFCGGYDLVASAEGGDSGGFSSEDVDQTVLSSSAQGKNHDPGETWDPMVDYQMMSRNVKGFMSLFHADKPVVCKVHGYCVAGGTDMALCSDLLVIEDKAKIGYPPARVWGSPTTSIWAYRVGVTRAKRLLYTGDCLSGEEAVEYLKDNSADLLLLDMIMDPGIDGLETYRQILEFNPDQKAIIASGFSETERVKEAQKLGVGQYIVKPYTMEKMGVVLKNELDAGHENITSS